MTATLFRNEVFAARREAWLGDTQTIRPIPGSLMSVVSLALVAAVIAYACLGHYTRRAHVAGILMPKTGLITVGSPVAGRIVSTSAVDGARVEKGELLYTLDVDAVSASGPTEQRVLAQLRIQSASVAQQKEKRIEIARVEKKALHDQLDNTNTQNESAKKQIVLQRELTESLRQRAEQIRIAAANGLALDASFQTQKFLYTQANSQLAQFEQMQLQLDGKKFDLQSKIDAFDATLAKELAEMDRQIAQLRQQIAESEAKHSIEVRAPEQGILTSLRVHLGQQVSSGSTLLTLLPTIGNLQANLYVDSSAIGFVAKGEPVMLRYAAFPFQRFGLYRGVVTEVTRAPFDAVDVSKGNGSGEEEGRQPARDRKGVYRILVKPDLPYVRTYGDARPLEAGMQVEADIALERRRLFRWMLDPAYHLKRSTDLVTGSFAP